MSKLRDFFRRLRSMSPDQMEEAGRRGAAKVDAMAVQSSPRALHRLRTRSLQAGYDDFGGGRRSVDNLDATTAARSEHGMDPFGAAGGIPPNYSDDYDDGRPRH
jgi:hypothetical protein